MPVRKTALLALFGLLPLLAQAHTHLQKSTPAADSAGAAPEQLVLQFSEATRLTALTLQEEGGQEARKLGPLPAQPDKVIRVAAPKLDPGVYVLGWRALGDDGHVMSGTLRFTVVAGLAH
jgi:methionine-rich copper-binding protein CopC